MLFQDIQYISVENQNQDFPKHFHDTFCISLIRKGIEKIEFEDHFLYSQANSISITNPFEVHSNPVVDKDIKVSFDTLYIPNQVILSLLNGKEIEFKNRQILDPKIQITFAHLLSQLKLGNSYNETTLKRFINELHPHSNTPTDQKHYAFESEYLKNLIAYIEHNLEDKIYLDELAKIANLNKFGFVKKFKVLTGMTPMNYVLMKKIFSAKTKISSDVDITELAYAYNFTDTAHFSHTFKKYIGISPKEYRNQQVK